jgi:phytanoyl-CoA hydroxylase
MTSETVSTPPESLLDQHGHLKSDLWLDQPDAHTRIDKRVTAGIVSGADAALLHKFVDDGYFTFHIDLDEADTDAFDDTIAEMWCERPAAQPISVPGRTVAESFAMYDGPVRPVGYRLPDLHGLSHNAMDLYLHRDIFRLIELVFEQPAIAFQSLYFEYGSTQALHRDPWYVVANPVPHLAAAWIALEDITGDSGPLIYVPGSHRVPWFQFEENTVQLTPKATQTKLDEYREFNAKVLQELGHPRRFICKRGDVFVWHAGLQHGGAKVNNPDKTRKSFVVHYSTAATYRSRTASMEIRDGGNRRVMSRTTSTVIERPSARGLDSPMKQR